MIETVESKAQFEKRREAAKAALRSATGNQFKIGALSGGVESRHAEETTLGAHDCVERIRDSGSSVPPAQNSKSRFDRVAYQREYMRRRRAAARNTDSTSQ